MKKLLTSILFIIMAAGCAAQVTPDSLALELWDKYPSAEVRKMLKAENPELFRVVQLDTTYDTVIKIYKTKDEKYLAAVIAQGNIWLVCDMGNSPDNIVQTELNGDEFRVVSPYANGTVPKHVQDIIDRLE